MRKVLFRLRGLVTPLSLVDVIFLLASLPIIVATALPEWNYFKLGIPFPFLQTLGNLPAQTPKIFLFEIYLFVLTVALLPTALRAFPKNIPAGWYGKLLLGIFFFGMAYLAFSIRGNTLLKIRNSAFLWYLWLPILLCLGRISFRALRTLAFATSFLALFLFLNSTARAVVLGHLGVDFIPHLGIYPLFYLAITRNRLRVWLPCLLLLAFSFATAINGHLQRTTLVGLVPVMLFALYWQRAYFSTLGKVVLFVALSLGLSKGELALQRLRQHSSSTLNPAWIKPQGLRAIEGSNNPLVKAEADSYGREKFRWLQWTDATGLFLENPWLGIGFENQVVFRVYSAEGFLAPNDQNWYKGKARSTSGEKPPIAGPHNSYLNAITRMGVLGSLVLVLHLSALFWYLRKRELLMGSIVYAHMVYCSFNVGLEGPVRSAVLLMLLSGPLLYRAADNASRSKPPMSLA